MSSRRPKAARYLLVAFVFLGAGAGTVYGWPWSKDMHKQPSIKPQEAPRRPPANSVPRPGKEPRRDRVEAGKTLRNPIKSTAASIENGRRLYQIYCALCHGPDGKGGGPVSQKFIPAPDLTLDVFRDRPDGFIYETIRQGGPIMPGQGDALTVEERWAIVLYLRKIQGREDLTSQAHR